MTTQRVAIGEARADAAGRVQAASEPSLLREESVAQGPFASLQNPDYRLFWGGALISNIGMWMQSVAQGWLVVTLTNSPFYVGLVSFCAMIPSLFLSLFGGVLADRHSKRHILMTAQVVSALLITLLATLIYLDMVTIWHVMVISFGNGVMVALASPSWQAIVPEIVGKKNLMNAIALNSAQFNLTRVIGPTLGGLAVKSMGVAAAYYFNALSYVAFLAAMLIIRPRHAAQRSSEASEQSVLRCLVDAFKYVRRHSIIRTVLLLTVVQTLFIFPYTTLLPVYAKDVLQIGAGGYSVLLASAGAGAFVAAIMLAFRGETPYKGRWMITAQFTFAAGVTMFAFSRWQPASMVALVVVGWSMVTFMATGNTLLQTLVPDSLRGRVMSIWMLAGLGMMPLGSLQAGAVAAWVSPTFALAAGAMVVVTLTLISLLREPSLLRGDPVRLAS